MDSLGPTRVTGHQWPCATVISGEVPLSRTQVPVTRSFGHKATRWHSRHRRCRLSDSSDIPCQRQCCLLWQSCHLRMPHSPRSSINIQNAAVLCTCSTPPLHMSTYPVSSRSATTALTQLGIWENLVPHPIDIGDNVIIPFSPRRLCEELEGCK